MSEPLEWVATGRRGKVLVRADAAGLQSPLFDGPDQLLPWEEIASFAVEPRRGLLLLDLRRNCDGTVATLALHRLKPVDGERLVDLLNQRLGTHVPNPLAEERRFAQQLRALAPRTWVTWGLVALNIAAGGAMLAAGADPWQPDAAQLLAMGGNTASSVQQGQWWRLLTAAFLHIGPLHMALNLLGLLVVGPTVERIYGHRAFLLLYLGCALAGSAASLHFSASTGVSVGASGAVFGVAGALLMVVYHHRRQLPLRFGLRTLGGIGLFVGYSLLQGMAPGVDNAAHVGGLAAGMALALILPERFEAGPRRRGARARSALAALFIAALAGALLVTAPTAPLDLRAALAANAAVERGLQQFARAVGELEQEARDVQAGRLAETESDERSRMVHAPRLRALVQQLSAIALPANDPRLPLLAATLRVSELLAELLAMESRLEDGRPVPLDPARWAAVNAELRQLDTTLGQLAAQARRPLR